MTENEPGLIPSDSRVGENAQSRPALGPMGAVGGMGALTSMGAVNTIGAVGGMGAVNTVGTVGTIGAVNTIGVGTMGGMAIGEKQSAPLRLCFFCDMHGHAKEKNIFLYGCDPTQSWLREDYKFLSHRNAPKQVLSMKVS